MRAILPLQLAIELPARLQQTCTWRLARVSEALRGQRGHEPSEPSKKREYVKIRMDSYATAPMLATDTVSYEDISTSSALSHHTTIVLDRV